MGRSASNRQRRIGTLFEGLIATFFKSLTSFAIQIFVRLRGKLPGYLNRRMQRRTHRLHHLSVAIKCRFRQFLNLVERGLFIN